MYPVALKVGSLTIHWYGVMMAFAFLVGLAVSIYLGRRAGKSTNFMSDLGCWVMVSGIIGSRIGHVLANLGDYLPNPVTMLYIHRGGMIYYGGFIGAAVGIVLFSLVHRENALRLFDIVVVVVPLSHAIGRLGCFLNGCCFGKIYRGILAVRYPLTAPAGWADYSAGRIPHEQVRNLMNQLNYARITNEQFQSRLMDLLRNGVIERPDILSLPVHPVQLYEAGLNIALFFGLLWFFRRRRFDGSVASAYLMAYSVIRFAVEFFRGDERMMLNGTGFTVAQVESMVLFAAGIASWLWLSKRARDKAQCGI